MKPETKTTQWKIMSCLVESRVSCGSAASASCSCSIWTASSSYSPFSSTRPYMTATSASERPEPCATDGGVALRSDAKKRSTRSDAKKRSTRRREKQGERERGRMVELKPGVKEEAERRLRVSSAQKCDEATIIVKLTDFLSSERRSFDSFSEGSFLSEPSPFFSVTLNTIFLKPRRPRTAFHMPFKKHHHMI